MIGALREFILLFGILLGFVVAATIAMWPPRPDTDPLRNRAYTICTPDEKSCTGPAD
jgi:hypothetical protein